MADKSLTIFDRLLDKEKQEEKPETIFDRLLREEGEEKEERYRVAGLTSQSLPTLPPPTEEDKKSSADIDREQAAAAREFFKAGEDKEEAVREKAVKASFLSLKPAATEEIQTDESDLKRAELPWESIKVAANGSWNATDSTWKRKQMRAFAEALTQMQSDGGLRKIFEMNLDDASPADQLKITRALHDSLLWAQDKGDALVTKEEQERMEKQPAEFHQGKVTPPKPPGFWENFLRMPTLEELEPANLWKGWERDSAALLEATAERLSSLRVTPTGIAGYRPPEERGPIVKGAGSVGHMAPTLALSAVLTPPVARAFKIAALPAAYATPTTLGTAGAASTFVKTADDPVSSWTLSDNPYIKSIEEGLLWATFPVVHKAVSSQSGTYLTKLLKKHPNLSKATQLEQGVVAEVAGMGSILAVMEWQNLPAFLEAGSHEKREMLLEMLGRAFAFGGMGVATGVKRPGPRGEAKPRELGPEGRAIEQLRRERNLAMLELDKIMENEFLMDIVQKSLERHWKIPTEAVPKSEAIETVIRRMEEAKPDTSKKVQDAISEEQAKLIAKVEKEQGPEAARELKEFLEEAGKLPPGKTAIDAGLIRELKAEEPPTPVEAEAAVEARIAKELAYDPDVKVSVVEGFRDGKSGKELPSAEFAETRNNVKPIDFYTDRLFHETDFYGTEAFAGWAKTDIGEVFASNTANLARGQGGKGVMLEFTTEGLEGRVHKKPTWDFVWESGEAEFQFKMTKQKDWVNNLKSITVANSAKITPAQQRAFNRYTKGWKSVANGDGSTTYLRPDVKPASVFRKETYTKPEGEAPKPPTPVEGELHPEQKGWASESMSERFGNLGSAQRGKPEYAGIVSWKWRPEVSILGEAAEHIGDLTHRMTGAGKVGSGVAESFEKIRAWRRTLHDKFPEGSFEDHNYTHAIRMGAKKRGVSEKRFKSELDKELQAYADAHRKLKTYNDPQTWARDAAVALGERRWNDARRLMSKLKELTDKGRFEWPMATLRDNVTNIPPPKELYSLAARIKEQPAKTKREVEAVKERESEAYLEGIERKEPFNEFEVAKRGESKLRRLEEEFYALEEKWIRAMDEAKAPKPPTPVEARLVTREEARKAADTQRVEPEDMMLEVTKKLGGGNLSNLLEHIGDISNRAQKDAGGGEAKLKTLEKYEEAARRGDFSLEQDIRWDLEHEGANKYVNERPDLKKLKDAGEGSKEWADAGIENTADIYRDAWADTEYLNKYVDGRLLEIKTILEPYVEAHKLHNKPVTEMGVLGKQLAIDLGEMNFDALRATSKKLRALYDEYNAAKTPEAKDQVWLRRATLEEEAPKPPTEATPRATPEVEALAKELGVNLDGFTKPKGGWTESNQIPETTVRLLGFLKTKPPGWAAEKGLLKVTEPKEAKTTPEEVVRGDKEKSDLVTKAVEREAAEIDAAKALKDEAKIEEAVEIAKETKEVGEEKIAEAAEGEMFPSAGTARKFHTTILRAKELARKEKDFDFIRRFDVNPDSAYFTVPTSRWAKTIETFDLDTAGKALEEYGATEGVVRIGDPQELVGSLLKGRKQQLLLEKANKTGDKADRQAYEDFVQTLANDRTFMGQMVQTYSYFKVSDPVAVRDMYQKAITEAGGAKLTVEEQGTLLDIIKRIEETRKKSEELAEVHRDAELNPELSEAEINKAFEKANDAMLDWERAVVEQINLVGDKQPKLAVDMIVAQWQGNFLTPTTHAVNIYGNIFPMAPRAAARTGSRVFEAADRFLWAKSREMKLIELEKLQEKSPDPIRGETIKRLQQLTDPMEQSKLIPERFPHLHAKAFTSGTGAERIWSAWKATRGKEGGKDKLEAFMKEFKRFKTPVGGDVISSLVLGSDVNLYETGSMNMSNMTRPVDAFRAWQRLFGGKKSSKNVETVSKDIFEATFGMPPTVHFKGLMAGDVYFRNKEMMRLIDEQAAVRKWSPEKRARAIRNPKLMFTEKEMAQLRNQSAMASFQHETGWTEGVQKANKWLSSGGAGRKALYLGWRSQTPYQKTLMNVTHEIFQFSPFGAPYTMARGGISGVRGAWRGYKEEGVKGIPRGIQESYMPTKENLQIAGKNLVGLSIAMGVYKWLRDDGIVAPDMNPVMSDPTDTAKVRYLTEETFHHGFINMSGLRRKFDNEDARWKEGDWVVDARRLGPLGHMLLSGAAVQRGLEKMPEKRRRQIEADWDKLIAHELKGSAVYANRYFWNQTMATGIKDFMQSLWWIKEGEGAGKLEKKLTKDFTSIFLPNTAQWLTKVDSPYKQSFKPSTVSEQLKIEWDTKARSMFDRSRMEKIRVKDEEGKVLEEDVPVGLLGYPIIVDLWGSPLETMGEGRVLGLPLASWKTATWEKTEQGREDFWDRFMAKTFNVVDFKKSGKIADPYSGEVYRLMMKTGKGDAVPPMYSNEITVGEGEDRRRYRLNQDQFAYKSIMEGRYRLDGVGKWAVSGPTEIRKGYGEAGWGFKQYMESPGFDNIPDKEKINELKTIYKRAYIAGVAALVDIGLMDEKSVRADLAIRKFNINPDNLPLTDDQLIEEPSGMRE